MEHTASVTASSRLAELPQAATPNTRIEYLYRDADNYKIWEQVVVSGRLAFDDIGRYLDDGHFIASEVGLPDPQLEWAKQGYRFPTDSDHVYVEVTADDIQPTLDAPTVSISASELLGRFKTASAKGWDVVVAVERLGLA
jgi:hypothetical protein